MSAATTADSNPPAVATPRPGLRVREAFRLCWPREHGSWSLALEPLALGLLVAPSAAGFLIGTAVLAGFFSRRPLRLALGGAADARRQFVLICVVVLGTVAATALAVSAALVGPAGLWPLLLGVPPGALFAWLDSRGAARAAAAELAGACAFAIVPAGLASAGGWPAAPALALAAVMAARSAPAVMTIRTCLRREKGRMVAWAPALTAAVAAVVATVLLARGGLVPWAAPAVMAVLLVRTAVLLGWRRQWSARRVGAAESALGGALVVFLAISWFR